jgi:hypothetical protein
MAASFGNRGQCDYAAANSVFDMAATVLGPRVDGRVASIAWGPWKGAGMVSPGLEAEMLRRGLSLLPLEEGATFFADELRSGKEPAVMALAGEPTAIRSFITHSLEGAGAAAPGVPAAYAPESPASGQDAA